MYKAKQLSDLPDWVVSRLSPESKARALSQDPREEGTTTILTPDFNALPLNGEDPTDIKARFGVDVRVLRSYGPVTGTHSIYISGLDTPVHEYLAHLMSTWPKNEKATE